jgi:hypothetical protein
MVSPQVLTELQEQLRETQSSLAGHVEKIRALETVIAEHDAIKREMSSLRESMEERRRAGTTSPIQRELERQQREQEERERSGTSGFELDDENDDARSVATLVPHDLERVEEEDEESLSVPDHADTPAERRRRNEELGRPRTPEPSGLGMDDDDHRAVSFTDVPLDRPASPSPSLPEELTKRLAALSEQLETALALSRNLQEQHAAAQDTISALQNKVASLEGRVEATVTQVSEQAEVVETLKATAPSRSREQERESLTEMVNEWKKNVEGQWSGVQEAWETERQRLKRATDEWERRAREAESTIQGAVARVDEGVNRIETLAREQLARTHGFVNGDIKHGHGLVTPPSPRSLSADSTRSRTRRRRHSRSSSRGRNSSPGAASTDGGSLPPLDPSHETSSSSSDGASAPASIAASFTDSPKRSRAPWSLGKTVVAVHDDEDEGLNPPRVTIDGGKKTYPLTPKASFDDQAIQKASAAAAQAKNAGSKLQPSDQVSLA